MPKVVPLVALVLLALPACGPSSRTRIAPLLGGKAPERQTSTDSRSAEIVALVGSDPITRSEFDRATREIAGARALEEIALDRALVDELDRRGIPDPVRTPGWRDGELERLSPNDPGALERYRTERSLGPVRFPAQLARTARLRALVQGLAQPTPQELDLALRIRYGARYDARVMVLPTITDASNARREVMNAGDRVSAFSSIARERSIDATASYGGRLGQISPLDPTYPSTVRDVFEVTPPGGVSDVLALDDAFAIVFVERVVAPVGEASRDRGSVERELRLRKERLAMETLASDLLARTRVTPMDDSLLWSWERRQSRSR